MTIIDSYLVVFLTKQLVVFDVELATGQGDTCIINKVGVATGGEWVGFMEGSTIHKVLWLIRTLKMRSYL